MVTSSKICVVIPFYQSDSAPLVRAIRSVLAQKNVDRPHVLIVDDGSPVSAQLLVEEHFPNHAAFIRIITQENSGAAKARNTGLDNLPKSTTCVAFLDSDDEWAPYHLANAVRLLERGCDFYFADHQRPEWNSGKFARIGLSADQQSLLDDEAGLYAYTGEILFPVMIDHMIQTSSVVYRLDSLGDIRFPVDLVLGEDEIFWVKAMRRAREICFCNHIEVHMGKGVNISQGGDWGDERSFQLMVQNIRYWQSVPDLLPEETQIEPLRRLRIGQLRQNFAASVWYRLRRGKTLPMHAIASLTSSDPGWLFSLWTVPFKFIAGNS